MNRLQDSVTITILIFFSVSSMLSLPTQQERRKRIQYNDVQDDQ